MKNKQQHYNNNKKTELKGCCLLHLSLNKSTCHFKSSFHSRENQILEICIFKFHDVIKCLSTKQKIHFTEKLGK